MSIEDRLHSIQFTMEIGQRRQVVMATLLLIRDVVFWLVTYRRPKIEMVECECGFRHPKTSSCWMC